MAYQPPADISQLTPPEIDHFRALTTHQKVLIAQACYAKGNRDFEGVSSLLRGHVLLRTVGEEWYDPRFDASTSTRIAMAEIEEVKRGEHDWKVLQPGRTKPPGTSPVAGGLGDLPPLPGM
ncbi:hypothetical protein JCM3766R1_004587 [Sporobolomyces carnicolor]